jgi:hypothetical protein
MDTVRNIRLALTSCGTAYSGALIQPGAMAPRREIRSHPSGHGRNHD